MINKTIKKMIKFGVATVLLLIFAPVLQDQLANLVSVLEHINNWITITVS